MIRALVRATLLNLACLGFISSGQLWAGSSLRLQPGKIGTYTVPNQSPYQSLTSFRVELRVHASTPCENNYSNIWDFGVFALRCFLDGTNDIVITDPVSSLSVVINTAGRSDFVLRIQRETATGRLRGEIWNADNTAYQAYVISGVDSAPRSASGARQVGGPTTSMNIAWVRWYSSLLPAGSRLPLSSIEPGQNPDLGSWTMENNLLDSGPRNMHVSMGSPQYIATSSYAPIAVAAFTALPGASLGGLNVTRAGFASTVSAADSYSFADTTQLTYRWSQLEGPTELDLEGADTSELSFSNTIFGQYKIRLRIQDADGRTADTEFVFGAVASDDQGRVLSADPLVGKVFGPLLRFGASPWPYLDDRHAAFAKHFGRQLSVSANYIDQWNQVMGGTITVTNGSNVVTGQDVAFQAGFCGGHGNTTPVSGRFLVIWYPAGEGKTGRRQYGISSCPNEQTLILDSNYVTTASATGLSYARMDCLGCWTGGSGNNNYYDNVMAHYALYYRTGLTEFLDYARTLADRWWTSPTIDEGRGCTFGDIGRSCTPPRVQALTGLLWRAHEEKQEYWPGLRATMVVMKTGGASLLSDIREQGYALAFVALGSMLDPDQAKRQEYRNDVLAALNGLWKNNKHSSGVWINYSYGYEGTATNPPNTINLTKGSNEITGNGTQNYWPPNTAGFWILRQNDNRAYFTLPGSTNTKLILDRPYEGESALGQLYQMSVLVGFGVQPFTLGILSSAFAYAYEATGDQLAKQYVLDIAHWLRRYGIRKSSRGLYYARLFPPCEPEPDSAPNCVYGPASDPAVVDGERYLIGEVAKAFTNAYMISADPDLRETGDRLIGAALGKLGGPESDSDYVRELDQTIQADKAKNFGFWFGFGAVPTWPAARLGQPAPPVAILQHVTLPVTPLSGALSTQVERTLAQGAKAVTLCTGTGPCGISLDLRLGSSTQILEHRGSSQQRRSRSRPQTIRLP